MEFRCLFPLDEANYEGEWYEGRIYHIKYSDQIIGSPFCLFLILTLDLIFRSDFQTNPFQSISVIWMDKELDSNEWVYSYNQSDCLLSPWEISPSSFVSKSDRNQNKDCGSLVIPSSFFSSQITPQSVLSALGNLDFSTPFSDYRVADVAEFTTMFPDKEDQLDFSILSQFEKV